MDIKDALEMAKAKARYLRRLAQPEPKTQQGREVEVLARYYHKLGKRHEHRAPVLLAIIHHLTPLIRDSYYRSKLPRMGLAMDDFVQEATLRVITVLDRYYNPKRGAFVSFAVMASKQVCFRYIQQVNGYEEHKAYFRDGLGACDDGDFDGQAGVSEPADTNNRPIDPSPSPLLRFLVWYGQDPGVDQEVLTFIRICEAFRCLPSSEVIGHMMHVSTSYAGKVRNRALAMVRDYLCAYEGINSAEDLEDCND